MGRNTVMYLMTEDGIKEAPKFSRIKSLFCKHSNVLVGKHCSKNGLRRISGADNYVICARCGKVLAESHSTYD